MDSVKLFSEVGFQKVMVDGNWFYEGPHKRLYRMEEKRELVAVSVRTAEDLDTSIQITFYKIMKEKDMFPILVDTLNGYAQAYDEKDPLNKEYFLAERMYPRIVRYVRDMMGKDIGEQEWMNLCCLYDAAIKAGGGSFLIAETCKEIMKMGWMTPGEYVLPELHELLLKVPDGYYDFVLGAERNMQGSAAMQRRVIRFLKEHPQATTQETIIYISMLNESAYMKDRDIEVLIRLASGDATFSGLDLPEQKGEVLEARDKYGWRISTVFTHQLIYRFRQFNGLCLVDYQDRCIGHDLLIRKDEETAEICYMRIGDELDYEGVRERVLSYNEQMAKHAGMKKIALMVDDDKVAYFEKLGYVQDPEREFYMWKELEDQVQEADRKWGLIFDMDGTLWDTAENVARSWNQVIEREGYQRAPITEADMMGVMGKTMDKIAEAFFPDMGVKEREDLLELCCREENDYLRENGAVLYPNLQETIHTLKERYHVYIVSNCQSGYIEAFLDHYHLQNLFEDFECYGNNGKQKAENIRLLADRNQLTKAAYVGDVQGDYDAAMEAGVLFIHAAYGFGSIKQPVHAIGSLSELTDIAKLVLGNPAS